MDRTELKRILSSGEVAVRIIRDVAELEWRLDLLLTRYYSCDERFFEFMDIIMGRLSFMDKVDILRKMRLPAKMVSQPNAVKSLEKLRKLRNVLAHSSYISDEDVDRLHSDNEIMRILSDYPKSYRAEVAATVNRLNLLLHSYRVRHRRSSSS